ncbi:MAG: flagellar biosynthesis protein FlhA [Actinomycetota bacterium]|nr:flagellar biosynthesis protein FlhA [Actinomycetota bacterium]
MMVVPLPAVVLDLLIVCNLSFAVVILLTSMSVERPLDFSIFPSLLLVATMLRLALNVSATRLVLLNGFAGKVIESFGHFVIGGSLVVGLVIFLILVVIQFVVITNGASRVAEVAARFTLDAMPGKQMAIDADLSSGLITEEQARTRRREVASEADFYGAMDGASKFVKGDAIAGIVITVINLFGGFIVGVMQRGLSLGEAVETYSLLTIGDGLVSQIPALLISIAAGLIVTRAATESDLGSDVIKQFGNQDRAMRIAAVAVAVIALIPGLPKLPFLLVASGLWIAASRAKARPALELAELPAAGAAPELNRDAPEAIASDMRIDPIELEIGYGLMDLVDGARGGDLLDRVRSLRRKVAMDLGLVIPPVRTRDNLELEGDAYVIRIHGVAVGHGEAPVGSVLVLGDRPSGMPGRPTQDPVFGMQASWVPAELASQAEAGGATVVDRGSVITAHLAEVVRTNAARLLSRQDVKLLVDGVRASDPVVADELTSAGLSLAEVQTVLHALLDEQVPIRDLVRILEVLSERARTTRDTTALTEAVRGAIGPAIAAAHQSGGRLPVLTLDPVLEQGLADAIRPTETGPVLVTDPETTERLMGSVADAVRRAEDTGVAPVLLCSGGLRSPLRRLLRSAVPGLPVLSYNELDRTSPVDAIGVIDLNPANRSLTA